MDIEGVLAVIGIFFVPIVMIILIVWFRNNARNKRYQLQADLAAKLIENGQTLPEKFFDEPKKQRNPLNIGIVCIAVGIGTALFIWLVSGAISGVQLIARASSIGIIPFFIGVAFLIIHFIEKKKMTDENAK